ncbi:MAG: NAD-dependent epimerase/dehydratase family protein [Pseudomonadota bacterium]
MQKNILVIGGTRQVGKLLVQKLVDTGHRVTLATRGRTPDHFGARVNRIVVDRHDAGAMRAAFAATSGYDVVYDLLCDNPLDAAIALDVFKNKTQRYVMTSSMDVYRLMMGRQDEPFEELDLDLREQKIDMAYPWRDPLLWNESRAAGKRQAEALLYRDASLPLVTVRIAHVIGAEEDARGKLAHYVALAQTDQALLYTNAKAVTSFVNPLEISNFLYWTGMQHFLGPVNAACGGVLSALDLHRRVGAVLGEKVRALPLSTQAGLSPFDYPYPYVMATARAASMGYRFSHCDDWLDLLIHQHQPALVCRMAA